MERSVLGSWVKSFLPLPGLLGTAELLQLTVTKESEITLLWLLPWASFTGQVK